MQDVSSEKIKYLARTMEADLCGIASVDRFLDSPIGFSPTDVLKECKSIIVVAVRFPTSTLSALSQAPYTFAYNKLVQKIDSITFQLSYELENLGSIAIPIPSTTPYEFWDSGKRHGQGVISLKHAAVRAGLGKLGKNTLLINNMFGNMLLLGAVLIDKVVEADPIPLYEVCLPGCRICIESCPAGALNAYSIEQLKCRSHSGNSTEGGGFIYSCNQCRKGCPNNRGIMACR